MAMCTNAHVSVVDRMFVSLKHKCHKLNPSQCDGIWRWGLWKVVRVLLGPKGRALMMKLVALVRRLRERETSISVSPHIHTEERPFEDMRRHPLESQNRALIRNRVSQYLILNFLPPER